MKETEKSISTQTLTWGKFLTNCTHKGNKIQLYILHRICLLNLQVENSN